VPQENAFTQSVEVKIKDSATVKQAIETALAGLATQSNIDITTIIPLDINVYIKGTETKVQPSEGTSVTITIPIPENLLANKDKVKVVCIIDGKLTFIDTKVILVEGVYCVQFNATHFSPYGLIVNNEATQTPADAGNSPKTGDNNRTIPLAILASLSLVTIEVILKKRKYKVAKRA